MRTELGAMSHTPLPIPLSAVEGIVWPAPAGGMQAVTLAALQQLEHSQYLPPDELRARQFRQVALLASHASRMLPFYRDRFHAAGFDPAEPIDEDDWSRLPILTREEVQSAGTSLHCREVPRQHGEIATNSTSGSTGTALVVQRTAIALFFWNVFALREVAWHGFDVAGKLAAIRIDWQRPAGSTGLYVKRHENWGPPLAALYPTGPAAVLDIRNCTIAEQAEWLRQEAPNHLVGFGVNLKDLARHCLAHGIRVPSLRSVYSQGEVLSDEARAACREAWGVEVVDSYSAVETGHLAFQCPDHPHLHIQSESAVVEILHEDGRPCRPGEVGRVVVTPLHNFAMPLIRYAIGDLAEVGNRCTCGRTLPVLRRVLGRTRDMLVLPIGERRFPFYAQNVFTDFPAVIQHQIVQKTLDTIDVRMVVRRALTVDDEDRLRAAIGHALGAQFRIGFTYCETIERSASGKFEEFRCEVKS
jgi:phenylacetate-CoA ligase